MSHIKGNAHIVDVQVCVFVCYVCKKVSRGQRVQQAKAKCCAQYY